MRGNDDMLREIESDGAAPVASTDAPDLMAITLAQLRLATAEADLDEAVARARENGRSWQQIGDILGMTRQGVNKRFSAA